MNKFSYVVIDVNHHTPCFLQDRLNRLGIEGFRLVCMTGENGRYAILTRENAPPASFGVSASFDSGGATAQEVSPTLPNALPPTDTQDGVAATVEAAKRISHRRKG